MGPRDGPGPGGRLPDILHDHELDLGGQLGKVEYLVGEARGEDDFGGG